MNFYTAGCTKEKKYFDTDFQMNSEVCGQAVTLYAIKYANDTLSTFIGVLT